VRRGSEGRVPQPARRAKPRQAASRQVPARRPGRTWRRREIECRSWGTVSCPGSSYQSQGTTSVTDRVGSESAGRHMWQKERRPPSSLAIGGDQGMPVTHASVSTAPRPGWATRPSRVLRRAMAANSDDDGSNGRPATTPSTAQPPGRPRRARRESLPVEVLEPVVDDPGSVRLDDLVLVDRANGQSVPCDYTLTCVATG
jgi:hypothetical protein